MLNLWKIVKLKELNSQNGLIWRHEYSCVILIPLTWYVLTLLLLTLVHVVCCLSHVKFYSWVHTINFCILDTIFGWPMILTQYMLPRTEPYLFSSLFSFYEMQRLYLDFWFPSALASLPHIKIQGELSIQARVGFFLSWHDVLYFQTNTILFYYFGVFDILRHSIRY